MVRRVTRWVTERADKLRDAKDFQGTQRGRKSQGRTLAFSLHRKHSLAYVNNLQLLPSTVVKRISSVWSHRVWKFFTICMDTEMF